MKDQSSVEEFNRPRQEVPIKPLEQRKSLYIEAEPLSFRDSRNCVAGPRDRERRRCEFPRLAFGRSGRISHQAFQRFIKDGVEDLLKVRTVDCMSTRDAVHGIAGAYQRALADRKISHIAVRCWPAGQVALIPGRVGLDPIVAERQRQTCAWHFRC